MDITFIKNGNTEFVSCVDIVHNLSNLYFSDPCYKNNRWSILSCINNPSYPDLLNNWITLSNDLDITHQMFLYTNANIGIPVDLKFILLLQCFQPLTELLERKHFLSITRTGKKRRNGTQDATFKDCINAVTDKYLVIFFNKESTSLKWEHIKQLMVNTRNRIAHVDATKTNFLTGEQCVVYQYKLFWLYRTILLELLGVSSDTFLDKLKNEMHTLNNWNHIIDNLII